MTGSMRKLLALAASWGCIFLLAVVATAARAQGPQPEILTHPQGLNYVGVYDLRRIDPDLTGAGVKFAVVSRSITYVDDEPQNDYRPSLEHVCFSDGQFTFHDAAKPAPGTSPHSTAICSILLGEDPNAFNRQVGRFFYQGAAPQSTADVYEFWHFLINNVFTNVPPEADVVTASIGSPFEDWWTRGIQSMAEQHGLIVVAGIGNGSDAHDTVLYPGAGANVIGVGVVNSVNTNDPAVKLARFSLAYPERSSFGPAADGRCKPDIVAPGNCLAADANEPNRYEPTGNWSSFSTPVVAGTIGLLVQKAKEVPDLSAALSPDGGNCVMKAILLNSATKLPFWHKGRLKTDDDHLVPLDYIQGAGMVNAVGAYEQLVSGRNEPNDVPPSLVAPSNLGGWDLNHLQESENTQNIYKITLAEPTDKMITATVVWNKHYKNIYPFEAEPEKDANLRLELWTVDPNDSNSNILLDYSDSRVDNVEHIYCAADANYTDYEIVVRYSDTTEPNRDSTHLYGLAWKTANAPKRDSIFWYDLNADGIVNELDFTVLLDNMLSSIKTPENYCYGDINGDGIINSADFQILMQHIGQRADWYTTKENRPE
jgi:hypothetical protein